MKNFITLFVLTTFLLLLSCSENEVAKKSPGHFTLSQLNSPHGRVSSATAFNLGDLKASKDFLFFLGNGGETSIFDIALSTDNPKFVISPKHIDVLPGKNATDNIVVPLVAVDVIHGLQLNGVGYTELLSQGENNATITIKGKLVVNGDSTEVTSTFDLTVNAKVMDVTLYSDDAAIDFSQTAGEWIGYEQESGLPAVPGYNFNPANIKIKNTGNVNIEILLRLMYNTDPFSLTLTPGQTSALNIPVFVNEEGSHSFAEVTIDGNGTITDRSRIRLGTNGKGYFMLSHDE
jgi:hypothetical protein